MGGRSPQELRSKGGNHWIFTSFFLFPVYLRDNIRLVGLFRDPYFDLHTLLTFSLET